MEVLQIKCPNCGASVQFNAGSQKLHCEYCLSDFTEEELKAGNNTPNEEENKATQKMQDDFNSHTNLYTCDSCGAEIISDENTAASFCHYCHNPVALKGRLNGEYRPELIIPFKFTREKAEEAFQDWCRRKWFLPSDFKSARQLEKMTGLYVPYWLADCRVNATLNAEGKIITSHTSGNYRVTNTRIYNVDRAAYMDYRGIPADGSKKLDDRLMDAVEPFNYNEFVPFSMPYLSGFYADKYDVSKAEALPRIKQRIESGAQQVLMDDIGGGYTSLSARNKYTNLINTDWHYAMLPVWFMTYKHNNKDYFFAMNAQTGKVAGIPPVSGSKVAVLAAALFIVFGVLGTFLGGYLI